MFKSITDIKNLRGARVLLRLDLNVPIREGIIQDDFRIKSSMKTLEYLRDAGARTVILSHIDEKEGGSLEPVFRHLSPLFDIFFSSFKSAPLTAGALKDGSFLLLENLRGNPGEVANDPGFASDLALLGDMYINEAFSVSHRAHASIVGLPKLLPSFAGFQFAEEVTELSKSFNPERPFLFILGGAKFETKMPLIKKFLALADSVFVGGALSNDIFKTKGFEVGDSVISNPIPDLQEVMANKKLLIPVDVVAVNALESRVSTIDGVKAGEKILDAGTETVKMLAGEIAKAKFVLWNGPLGDYEKGFPKATEDLARLVAESSAHTVIGGGDTLAVLSKLGILEKFSFVSTGGGAMLEFLANETLPGITALEEGVN